MIVNMDINIFFVNQATLIQVKLGAREQWVGNTCRKRMKKKNEIAVVIDLDKVISILYIHDR